MSDSVRKQLDDLLREPVGKDWRSHDSALNTWSLKKGEEEFFSWQAKTYTVRGNETIPAGDHFFDYNISVLEGAVLTIDPGARIFFASLCGIEVNNGKIVSNGEEDNPVEIYRMQGSRQGSSIKFFGNQETSVLRHTEIHGEEISFGPVDELEHIVEHTPPLVKLNEAHVIFEDSTIFLGQYCSKGIDFRQDSHLAIKGGGIVGGPAPIGVNLIGMAGKDSRLQIERALFRDLKGQGLASLTNCTSEVKSSTFRDIIANSLGRGFTIGPGTLTATGNTFLRVSSDDYGGVFYVSDGKLKSRGNRYEQCSSKEGGVVYVSKNGHAFFEEDDFIKNQSESGGVVYIGFTPKEKFDERGHARLISCTGRGNNATNGGIAYLLSGGLIVEGGKYRENKSKESGNLVFWQGDWTPVSFKDVNYLAISSNNFAHRKDFFGAIEKKRKI